MKPNCSQELGDAFHKETKLVSFLHQ